MHIDPFIAVLVGIVVIGGPVYVLCAWAIERGIKDYFRKGNHS